MSLEHYLTVSEVDGPKMNKFYHNENVKFQTIDSNKKHKNFTSVLKAKNIFHFTF